MGIKAGNTKESNANPQRLSHEIQNYEIPLESHARQAFLPESIREIPNAESSNEMQILVFVIVRFVKMQGDIMFLIF